MGKFFRKLLPVIGAIMLVAVPGFGAIWGTIATAFIVGGSVLDARANSKRAKRLAAAAAAEASQQTVMIRNPIVPRRIDYGRTRLGGIWAYIDNSSDNKYLYLVLLLCDGPIKSIDEIYFDDQLVTLDGSDPETTLNGTGKWADKVRLTKHLGTADQTVDTDLENDSTEWTSNHRLRGIAYISLRLTHDPAIFPNSLPNVSVVVCGRNDVVDGRTDTPGYSANPALCLAHYMSLSNFGPNVDFDNEINHTDFDAAANVCDEEVALAATGTFTVLSGSDANQINSTDHGLFNSQIVTFSSTGSLPSGLTGGADYFVVNATKDTFEVSASLDGAPVAMSSNGTGEHSFTAKERRYTFNGVVSTDNNPEDIMRQFRDSMGGVVAAIGGEWAMYAGAYLTPTFTITESMLVGPIKFRPRRSKRERFNTVKGFFVSHADRFQPVDYPVVTNATYVTNDAEELSQGFDLPNTNTPSMANRLAKVLLEQSRRERNLNLTCNIEALRAQAGKTVLVNLPRYNIDNVPFNVDGFTLSAEGGKVEISLTLNETASAVYSWASGTDEQAFAFAVEPVLSDGRPAAPTPANLINSVNRTGGRELVSVLVKWDATTDALVLNGGLVVVQHKKSADPDSAWQGITGDPSSVEYPFNNLDPDTEYDFRVAWRNQRGAQSDWTTRTNHQTASSSSSAWSFVHTQSVPASTWVIAHNLGYRPTRAALFDDEDGSPMEADELVGSDSDPSGKNEIKIVFNVAVSGVAYLS